MPFFNELILDKIYKLNIADRIFIIEFEKKPASIEQIITTDRALDLDFIIKIAHANKKFESLCTQAIYDKLWQNQFSLLGKLFVENGKTESAPWFHVHQKSKDFTPFDFLRGVYFYTYAVKECAGKPTKFDYPELSLLKEGIKYKSVHCTQRYNLYIFNECEKNSVSDEKKYDLLKTAISNCKKLIPAYGSYAYMMLAEAYYRYAQLNFQSDNQVNFEKGCNAAIKACKQASVHLEESASSIHNASLGKGLQASNSLGITSPDDAIELINNALLSLSKSSSLTMSQ